MEAVGADAVELVVEAHACAKFRAGSSGKFVGATTLMASGEAEQAAKGLKESFGASGGQEKPQCLPIWAITCSW